MCFYCDVWISRMDSFKFADLINNFLQWIRLLPLRHILIWKRLVPVHGDTHRQVHYHPDTPHRVHPIHGTHHWVPPDMQCPQGSIDLVLWILILVRFQKLHIISPHPSRLVKVVSEQCTRPSYLLATGLLWSEQKRYETTSNCRLCISMHLWYFSFQRPGFFLLNVTSRNLGLSLSPDNVQLSNFTWVHCLILWPLSNWKHLPLLGIVVERI